MLASWPREREREEVDKKRRNGRSWGMANSAFTISKNTAQIDACLNSQYTLSQVGKLMLYVKKLGMAWMHGNGASIYL
jgi:hypothetical protein